MIILTLWSLCPMAEWSFLFGCLIVTSNPTYLWEASGSPENKHLLRFLAFSLLHLPPSLQSPLIHSSPSPSTSSQILSMFPIKYIYSIVTPFSSHCHHLISLPYQGYCSFFPICFTESKLFPHTIYPIMHTSQSPLNVISSHFPNHFTVALCFLVCLSASLFLEPSLVLPM